MKCAACVATFPPRGRKRFCSKLCADVSSGKRFIGPQGAVITCAGCGERRAVIRREKQACHDCYPEWVRKDNVRRAREYELTDVARKRKQELNRLYKAKHRDRLREANRRDNERMRRRRGIQPRVAKPKPGTALIPSPMAWHGPQTPVKFASDSRTFIAGTCAYEPCSALFMAPVRHQVIQKWDRFCSKGCRKRWWRQQNRQAQREEFRNVRIMVFVSDGWICHLCGESTVHESVPHPYAPTVDHVVPIARGGPDIIENLRTAHFICNSQKGAMTMDEWNGRSRASA